jgi:uncharacterized protein (DUF111 family)
MRIGYLECFSGISGDMFLGALVDAGVPLSHLAKVTTSLNVGGAAGSAQGHARGNYGDEGGCGGEW